MGSITIRRLEDKLKKQLRLRAARHGRSVEDEVRTILRSAAADSDEFATSAEPKSGVIKRMRPRRRACCCASAAALPPTTRST